MELHAHTHTARKNGHIIYIQLSRPETLKK